MKEFLERATKTAKLSYRDLQIILDALPTPLSWSSLPDGHIQFVNRAFTKTFGYKDGQFTTVEGWIQNAYTRDEDRYEARRRWDALWRNGATGVSEIEAFDVAIRCADGSVRTVQHRGILLHDIAVGIATFEDVSERERAEAALRRIAYEDSLTGLANRRVLQDFWAEKVADQTPRAKAALLLVDLDGFKGVNDRLGHDAGDQALITTAKRLLESVRTTDLVCRIGGDEFVVLLPDLHNVDQVEQMCWRIGTALARPFHLGGRRVVLGASIGASLYPQDGKSLKDILKHADEALYRTKTSHKGEWEWFKPPKAA